MSKPVELFIPGEPVGWMRVIPRKMNGGFIRNVNPTRMVSYQDKVSRYALMARVFPIPKCPVEIELLFCFKKPKSAKRELPTVAPDIDNLTKNILDGMNGHMYEDDKQVVKILAQKKYDEKEGVQVLINYLKGGD